MSKSKIFLIVGAFVLGGLLMLGIGKAYCTQLNRTHNTELESLRSTIAGLGSTITDLERENSTLREEQLRSAEAIRGAKEATRAITDAALDAHNGIREAVRELEALKAIIIALPDW